MEVSDQPVVVEAPPPPAPPPAATAKRAPSPMLQLQREEEAELRSWIDALAGEAPVKVTVRRKKPMRGASGEKLDGILETVDERIDEEYLRDTWGGGDYTLQIQTQQADGRYKYLKTRSVSLAGDTKMHGVTIALAGGAQQVAAVSGEGDGLAGQAFTTMTNIMTAERQRADLLAKEARQNHGFDAAAMAAMNQPLYDQLRAAQELINNLQTQMLASVNKAPPKDEFRDKLLERAIGDDSARIQTITTMYEGRIDRLKDDHASEIKRLEDKHDKAIERLEDRHEAAITRMEDAHKRELASMEKSQDFASKQSDGATTMRVESLKSEIGRLERDLTAAMTKIATLEAKKDQSLKEKAEELLQVQEAIEGLGGGKDDDGDGPWYKQALDALANSEAAVNLVNRIAGGPSEDQPQNGLPPGVQPGVPFQGPDGQVYVADQMGQVHLVDPRQLGGQQRRALARGRRRAPAQQQAQPQAPQQRPGMAQGSQAPAQQQQQAAPVISPNKVPKPKDVAIAVNFMENAIKNGTPPDKFAQTARNLVPGDILVFIQQVGIDNFLNRVAQPGSVLASLRGRQFARAVMQYLVSGEITPPAAEVAVVPAPANDEAEPLDDGNGAEVDELEDLANDGGEG